MAETFVKSSSKTQLLDQMLEDLAGEELSEYNDDFEVSSSYEKYSTADEFADIDSFH